MAVRENHIRRTGGEKSGTARVRHRHGATWLGSSHERKRTSTYILINDRNNSDSKIKTQGMTDEGEEGGSHEK